MDQRMKIFEYSNDEIDVRRHKQFCRCRIFLPSYALVQYFHFYFSFIFHGLDLRYVGCEFCMPIIQLIA